MPYAPFLVDFALHLSDDMWLFSCDRHGMQTQINGIDPKTQATLVVHRMAVGTVDPVSFHLRFAASLLRERAAMLIALFSSTRLLVLPSGLG